MKFTDGLWRDIEKYNIQIPKENYETIIEDNKVTMYGPFSNIKTRGNTLNCGLMKVELEAIQDGIIKVRLSHNNGELEKLPKFILENKNINSKIEKNNDSIILKAGELSAVISTDSTWGLTFKYNDNILTKSSGKSMGYITDLEGDTYLREQLAVDVNENIYGLGERFTAFVKNGQTVDMWNADGGTDSDQAYKNIPFYVSSKGYGVFVNHPEKVSFEVCNEVVSKCQFSVPGEYLEYYIIGGKSIKDTVVKYTDLTGKPALPPAWSFGLWLTTSFTTNYDEDTVLSFIDGMIDREIPLSAFHFDCFWMKEFEWCNFQWDDRVFKNPKGLIENIHDRGVKVCVWINSYIAEKSPLFKEGLENDYFVKTGDGDVWQWDNWQGGMALVDFTNPKAKAWYQKYLEDLCDMGVDSFKTDFGERIPVEDMFYGKKAVKYGVKYFDNSDSQKMHNFYTYLYNEAVFEVLEKKYGKNQACLFARSATVGGQKFPVHWGGDNLSTYPSMAESLRGGLSLSFAGFGYWSHDIGGFEAGCTPDIYKRWTQFGLLSSHSRYHGNSEYKVPWLYGDEAVEVTKKFTKLKLELMPYLFKNAVIASEEGIPMMRPLIMDYDDDPIVKFVDTQYMLGENILVAPIFNPEGRANYYLPKGKWTNILTGEVKEGNQYYNEVFDYFTLPLMAKENSVIVYGEKNNVAEYDYDENFTLSLYQLKDNEPIFEKIYNTNSELVSNITVSKNKNTIDIKIDNDKNYNVQLNGINEIKRCDSGNIEITKLGVFIKNLTGSITIEL